MDIKFGGSFCGWLRRILHTSPAPLPWRSCCGCQLLRFLPSQTDTAWSSAALPHKKENNVSFFFFLMWTMFLKVFIEFVTILFLFYVLGFFFFFFGCKACGILVPQPGIKLGCPALEGEILNTGLLGRSPQTCYPSGFPQFVMVLPPSLALSSKPVFIILP